MNLKTRVLMNAITAAASSAGSGITSNSLAAVQGSAKDAKPSSQTTTATTAAGDGLDGITKMQMQQSAEGLTQADAGVQKSTDGQLQAGDIISDDKQLPGANETKTTQAT